MRGITLSTMNKKRVLIVIASMLAWIVVGIELIDPLTAPLFSDRASLKPSASPPGQFWRP